MLSSQREVLDEADGDFVRALARGLSVLECFDAEHREMTLSEVAGRVGLSRGSTRRLLLTLESLAFVGFRDGRFHLRPRVLRLGFGYLSALPVWTAARPHIEEVAAETGESCSAAVLDGREIVYVARQAAKRIISDYIAIGTRFPAHATSMGKVLLAGLPDEALWRYLASGELQRLTPNTITDSAKLNRQLDEVRSRGWAINDEEIEPGLRSIAVPIRDGAGRVAAAMNVSAPAARVSPQDLAKWLPVLQRASNAITLVMTQR